MSSTEHDLNVMAAYVENRLDAHERLRMVEHLASCIDCRSTLAAYTRVSGSVSEASPLRAGQKWFRRPGVWLPIAATVALTTVAVVGVLQPRPVDERSSVTAVTSSPTAPASPADRDLPLESGPAPLGTRSGNAAIRSSPGQDDLSRRRGGERVVDGKTFRLVVGEWVDQAYDPFAMLPEVAVRTAEQRAALIQQIPSLRPFAALGARVIVVYDGTVYKFGTDPLQ